MTKTPDIACRPDCGACCIAPSISSAIPDMPFGKPPGVRCIQLDSDNACRIFGDPRRPAVCGSLRPSVEMCGVDRGQAMYYLERLEYLTGIDNRAVGQTADCDFKNSTKATHTDAAQ